MLGAVGIGRTLPSGVSGERYVGMVEAVEDPRTLRRGCALVCVSAGRTCCGGTCRTRCRARRSDPSGVMIENGNPSLLCARAPDATGNPAKIAANTTMLKRLCISLIQHVRQIKGDCCNGKQIAVVGHP